MAGSLSATLGHFGDTHEWCQVVTHAPTNGRPGRTGTVEYVDPHNGTYIPYVKVILSQPRRGGPINYRVDRAPLPHGAPLSHSMRAAHLYGFLDELFPNPLPSAPSYPSSPPESPSPVGYDPWGADRYPAPEVAELVRPSGRGTRSQMVLEMARSLHGRVLALEARLGGSP